MDSHSTFYQDKIAPVDPAPHPKARAAYELNKGKFSRIDPKSGSMVIENNTFAMATLVK